MATMRAALYRSFGEAREVFEIAEVERPEPARGEVLVRVVISAVNPTDWKARRGSRPMVHPFVIPNQDGAGVVEAVGEGVDRARVGERVWLYFAAAGRRFGTAAEYTVIPERRAVSLPDAVSFELGASMGVPALTAHRALTWDGPIGGRSVLVTGGAGAVGHYAIELARHLGAAIVVTTVSGPHKAALADAAGADVVINYRTDDVVARVAEAVPGGVDRVVEVALGANIRTSGAVLAPHGTIVCYSQDSISPQLDVRALMFGNNSLRFMMLYDIADDAIDRAVESVAGALEAGALTELPSHRYPLDGIADAHDACEAGAVGKVLIDLGA